MFNFYINLNSSSYENKTYFSVNIITCDEYSVSNCTSEYSSMTFALLLKKVLAAPSKWAQTFTLFNTLTNSCSHWLMKNYLGVVYDGNVGMLDALGMPNDLVMLERAGINMMCMLMVLVWIETKFSKVERYVYRRSK